MCECVCVCVRACVCALHKILHTCTKYTTHLITLLWQFHPFTEHVESTLYSTTGTCSPEDSCSSIPGGRQTGASCTSNPTRPFPPGGAVFLAQVNLPAFSWVSLAHPGRYHPGHSDLRPPPFLFNGARSVRPTHGLQPNRHGWSGRLTAAPRPPGELGNGDEKDVGVHD
jgi:hypothetical protein